MKILKIKKKILGLTQNDMMADRLWAPEYGLMRATRTCLAEGKRLLSLLPGGGREEPRTKPGWANLQSILWKAKQHEATDAFLDKNFILQHERWVQPEWALQSQVSLFALDCDCVVFTVTEDGDVYSSEKGPFMYITQYRLATHILTMDMETFNILAQGLQQREVRLVIVANTGRCGSTLLAQMFESVAG